MARSTPFSTLSRISLLFALASVISSSQASHIFARQAPVCGGNSNLQQCGTGFPSDFCCPKDTTCMSLNSGAVRSVICCPAGSDCAFIQTITCDVTQLNATQHPENQMHLSETDGVQLPKCGDKCCPLGYSCKGGMCSKDASQSPTSSARSTPSASKPAAASQTSSCTAPAAIETNPGFDGRSFAAGFFPGIVIGALGAIGLIWFINRRRDRQRKERYSGDFGHVSRQISDPIYDPQHAARTDFIRRSPPSAQHSSPNSGTGLYYQDKNKAAGAHGLTPRIKSMWDRTPKLNFGFATGLPSSPAPPPPAIRAGNGDPYTTPRQHRRKHKSHRSTRSSRPEVLRTGSTETIDVLMPAPSFLEPPKAPAMRENRLTTDSSNTTFTKLMERAGFDESGRKAVRDHSSPNRI